jgi:hypothetical protein
MITRLIDLFRPSKQENGLTGPQNRPTLLSTVEISIPRPEICLIVSLLAFTASTMRRRPFFLKCLLVMQTRIHIEVGTVTATHDQ